MAKKAKRTTKKTKSTQVKTTDYRHTGQKRKNNPPATMAGEGTVPKVATVKYRYSPHLPPVLRFDPTGKADKLPDLLAKAAQRPLTGSEVKLLAEALRNEQPWLEWAAKQEDHNRGFFEVDPVALHIHERVSTQAILRAAAREDVQRDLFADPQQTYSQAVQFYMHDVDWANRMVLGDSLQVMTSLARREELAGKVQMIYIDPPYGIKFSSNFQPQVGQRDVKDRDQDLTREPEMVRAYRDTWTLGIHSYLAYLRDRVVAAKELLTETGSIFVQISDENLHRIRCLMDEVFGHTNFCALIRYQKTGGFPSDLLQRNFDYIIWYARDKTNVHFNKLFIFNEPAQEDAQFFDAIEKPTGEIEIVAPSNSERIVALEPGERLLSRNPLSSDGHIDSLAYEFSYEDEAFRPPPTAHWKTVREGMERLLEAGRLIKKGKTLRFRRFWDDHPASELGINWTDTGTGGFVGDSKVYVVQTDSRAVERCVLMTTSPGDIVLDPTCGSGTTAYVAEQWGRRWITCDTSRVALSLARQRLMTARFPYYELRLLTPQDELHKPAGTWLTEAQAPAGAKKTFKCKVIPHITLKSIARNVALDAIFEKYQSRLSGHLVALNDALKQVTDGLRQKLVAKLMDKQKRDGKKSISDAERRRWELPDVSWRDWAVPFDTDPDWPRPLQQALTAYRAAWREKTDEVNACVAANAEMEELVDKPEEARGIVRVTGPFTVEGVRPEEMSLGHDEVFDPAPNDFAPDSLKAESGNANLLTYLSQMVQHLRADGVTFLGNQPRRFSRVDAIFEDASGSLIHAEGAWGDGDASGPNTVAVSFGPQYGPVTALQVEESIRESRQYKDLVIAGFSFDAEASAVIAEKSHPRLRVHAAWIRPDLNQAMEGLLKDTPNSQLFTVFGQPEVEVKETKAGWVCTLTGVDIYDPVNNTVLSSGADKVAAWFLDSDFDGRCFCITQAFFPDQNAWQKIAKALGNSADPEAFEAFKGTKSLPFAKGKYGRVAVKVIDPRGNEVMAIRKLD
jgi:adenine-specific DNA-methyltransferase